ncbi:MAG: hypothetical protein K2X45_05435 [Phreatobacter sp.]|nr:hypothetical protein [Phreatobacter sp.]
MRFATRPQRTRAIAQNSREMAEIGLGDDHRVARKSCQQFIDDLSLFRDLGILGRPPLYRLVAPHGGTSDCPQISQHCRVVMPDSL